MTVRELYEWAVRQAIEIDPRGSEEVQRLLADRKQEYDGLDESRRRFFDTERLWNPFGDTRLICGDPDMAVTGFVTGVDIGGPELLLADALRRSGRPINLVITHHTSGVGHAMADAHDTMWVQVHMMTEVGVPQHVAEAIVTEDIKGRPRGQDYRIPQIAEALGMALIAIHTPADYHMGVFLRELLDDAALRTVGDLQDAIRAVPEVEYYLERAVEPETLATGDRGRSVGPVYIVSAGGWNPSPRAMEAICEAGVGTFILVAASDELRQIAEKHCASIIIFPHYPADSVGMNLLYDKLLREAPMEIVPCSNFFRVARV